MYGWFFDAYIIETITFNYDIYLIWNLNYGSMYKWFFYAHITEAITFECDVHLLVLHGKGYLSVLLYVAKSNSQQCYIWFVKKKRYSDVKEYKRCFNAEA